MIEIENNAKDSMMTFVREVRGSRVVAIMNLSPYTIHADFNTGIYAGVYQNAITGERTELSEHVDEYIAPWNYRILVKKEKYDYDKSYNSCDAYGYDRHSHGSKTQD